MLPWDITAKGERRKKKKKEKLGKDVVQVVSPVKNISLKQHNSMNFFHFRTFTKKRQNQHCRNPFGTTPAQI